jgi:hypothetical protein
MTWAEGCVRFAVLAVASLALFFASHPPAAHAETYQQYLERLRNICAVECLEPKQFQRAARKRDSEDADDMAIIMDVAEVRRSGDKYELHNIVIETNALVEQSILGSAGIDTSFGTGIGGLSRNRPVGRNPNVVVIELDEATFLDILNLSAPPDAAQVTTNAEGESDIVVDGDRDREVVEATLPNLRSYFRNRRIVVRGTPRLAPVWVGGRLDYRRKQVTLMVDNAEDIALLPEYDADGNAVFVDPLSR